MTRDELKTILASKENKLAGGIIEAIKSKAPLADIQQLVEMGAPDVFYERDPAHPRSKFRVHNVLDACFETSFGATNVRAEKQAGGTAFSASLDIVHESEGREEAFGYLLNKDFKAGSNGLRGPLFKHIMNSCFYADTPDRKASALKFATILCKSGKYDVQHYARNNYGWVGHPADLDMVLALGADPKGPDMIDCALTYVDCSPSSGRTVEDRVEVVRRLLEMGAKPEQHVDKLKSIMPEVSLAGPAPTQTAPVAIGLTK